MDELKSHFTSFTHVRNGSYREGLKIVVMKNSKEEGKERERRYVEEERKAREEWKRNLINVSFFIIYFFILPKNPGPIFFFITSPKKGKTLFRPFIIT